MHGGLAAFIPAQMLDPQMVAAAKASNDAAQKAIAAARRGDASRLAEAPGLIFRNRCQRPFRLTSRLPSACIVLHWTVDEERGASGMGNGDEAAPGDKVPAPAQPGTYDQAFFLALAAKGKDEWNTWRRDPANEDVYVTFEGADFSEAPWDKINFEGFEFGHGVNFRNCKCLHNEPERQKRTINSKRQHISPGSKLFGRRVTTSPSGRRSLSGRQAGIESPSWVAIREKYDRKGY